VRALKALRTQSALLQRLEVGASHRKDALLKTLQAQSLRRSERGVALAQRMKAAAAAAEVSSVAILHSVQSSSYAPMSRVVAYISYICSCTEVALCSEQQQALLTQSLCCVKVSCSMVCFEAVQSAVGVVHADHITDHNAVTLNVCVCATG
jgi:hypothetical protein